MLGAGKELACRVAGLSMSPFIGHDDVVWLRPVTADELRFGDIVIYDRDGLRIVHRFLRRKLLDGHEVLVIKGDPLLHDDPPVLANQVVARVVMVQKGRWKVNLETRSGRLLNAAMALLSSCPGLLSVARTLWRFAIPRRFRKSNWDYTRLSGERRLR